MPLFLRAIPDLRASNARPYGCGSGRVGRQLRKCVIAKPLRPQARAERNRRRRLLARRKADWLWQSQKRTRFPHQ